jgi:Bacteriophage baseplate protein W
MTRHDYFYPFRIDSQSGQAMQSAYPSHVDQMIRQVLLTSPGERVNLPDFGCGLRSLVFAPNSDALAATAKMMILTSLNEWLSDHIQVVDVTVSGVSDSPDPAQLLIRIDYILLGSQTAAQTEVLLP